MKEERINKPPILKVGDKVKVKSKEWFDAQEKDSDGDILLTELTPGGFYFTTEMIKHGGEEFYITRIEDRESVPYYKFRDSSFKWEFWMFDLIEDSGETIEYKEGDKIQINSREWYLKNRDPDRKINENGCFFIEEMAEHCGKTLTIESVHKDNKGHTYYYLKENSYAWQSWMFSPVKKEVSDALYHVGERVTINSKIWLAAQNLNEYGNVVHSDSSDTCLFTSGMTKYCGRTVTIDRVKVNVFGKHLYTFKEIPYTWHSWMFVPTLEVEKRKKLEEHVDKKSEHHIYQIGDVVIPPSGEKAIIIGTNDPNYYNIVYTSNYENAYLLKGHKDVTLVEAGKYKSLIDTKLSLDAVARLLRNRFGIIAKSKSLSKEVEAMPKDSNSQSNSSEFDLTKVIYKSKRIY